MKKRLVLLLVTVMAVGCLAGCQSAAPDTTEGKNTAAASTEETNNSSEDEDTLVNQYNGHDLSEKITLTFNVIDTEKQNIDARYDYLSPANKCQ